MLKLLDLIPLLVELAIQWFRLRNKLALHDVVEKAESTIDKLNARREKARAKTDSASQDEASKLMTEILDEKKKLKLFLEELGLDEKPEPEKV